MSEIDIKSAAHDLNNILTGLLNNIELLKEQSDSAKLKPTIKNLESNTKRATEILQTILSKSKTEKNNLENINLNEIAEEVIDTLKFTTSEKVKVLIEPEENVNLLIANHTDIYRIILNLVKNAAEAIKKRGKIILSIANDHVYEKEFVTIKVKDSGPGISKDIIHKIFDENFSTKNKDQQSGIGLSIVKKLVENYNGEITVNSNSDGTEFKIKFPAISKKRNSLKKILLAEDDEYVSEVLADLLMSYDYNVTVKSDGKQALNELKKDKFDLLLIDKKMPEIDGINVIKEFRKNGNDTPIILASGSNLNEKIENFEELQINKVINKPYNFPEILAAINELIN